SWSGSLRGDRRPSGRLLDGGANSTIGATAADVARHGGVDVAIAGTCVLGKECRRGHDLARLAVAALGDVERDPGFLDLLACGRAPDGLDGGDVLAGDGAHRSSAGPDRLAVEVYRTGAAQRH